MSIDVEYAIKKDIRNNPVVREIDVEQKRDFARTLRLAVAVVGMLLFAALQQFRGRSVKFAFRVCCSALNVQPAGATGAT
jgi:hypothetical protein